MAIVAVIVLLTAAVLWLARGQKRVRVRSCCSSAPWPPVDLVDDPAYAEDGVRAR